jgi:hypothetical protein
MVKAILGDKPGDGLRGQEKDHSVKQRMMLAGTCQKFFSDIVEKHREKQYGNSSRNIVLSIRTRG